MKNKIIFIFVCLLIFAITATSFVLAEDDSRELEDNYKVLESADTSASTSVTSVSNSQAPVAPVSVAPVNNFQVSVIPEKTMQISLIDSDSDGVIDSLDKYPGEDDFAFGINDINLNGIIDSLEYLQVRED